MELDSCVISFCSINTSSFISGQCFESLSRYMLLKGLWDYERYAVYAKYVAGEPVDV